MAVAERRAGLVQNGQSGRAGDDEIHRFPGGDQGAQDGRGVRRPGRAGDSDDPRPALVVG